MNKLAIILTTVALLGLTGTALAGPGQGYPEQCVDTQTNPGYAIWEVCLDTNSDDEKGRNKAKVVNAFMKVWDEVLQRWVRLRGTLSGGMAVTIMGPLGSRPHAESVSIAPPTDARFQVSKDVNANAVTNPIWNRISQDGTNAVDATHPLPISDDLAANAVTNPMWFQISQDGTNPVDATHPVPISDDLAANAVTNPMWFQISQDGTNPVDATHPIPISDDLVANAVTNPMWFQISQDGTNPMDATHPVSISKNLTVNSVTNPVWNQLSQDGTTAVGAANPLPISSTMAANTLANPIKVELSDGTNAFFDNTTYPGYTRTQDGDSTVLQDVIDTSADGISTALNPEMSFCVQGLYNGATIDMGRNSATKAAMVNVENHPAAYDEANGWVKNKKEETAVLNPAKSTGTTAGGVLTDIMTARYVLNDPNFTITLRNVGANVLTDAAIDSSPDGAAPWAPLTWISCDALAVGAACVYSVAGNSNAYIRIQAKAAGGSETTIDAYYTSNKN